MNAGHKEQNTGESKKENVNLEEECKNIVDNIMEIIGSSKVDKKELGINCHMQNDCKSSTDKEEHDEATCACHVPEHLKFAVELINSKDVLLPLIKKMYQCNILDDFLLMLELISRGVLDANNIPLTLAVELAKLMNCESTTGMQYRNDTLDFWLVFYRTCHASGLNLMSGKKNTGDVTGNKSTAGKYDPKIGSFNFAVPDVKTILRHQKHREKCAYAGIINSLFDLVDKMKQFVLEYDAKRIATGLGDNRIGDVNLWGHEGHPSLQECEDNLKHELSVIEILLDVANVPNTDVFPLLKDLIQNISNRIKKKRYSILGHEKYLQEITIMCEGNRRLCKKYKKSIDDTKASIYTLKIWIQDALELNHKICYIMSEINRTNDLYICADRINLNEQGNVKILLYPELIAHKINLDVHTHVVKQRSEKWFQLCKEA